MARGKLQGWAQQGGHTVLTDGRVSTDKVQQSFPLATVTVFDEGTLNLSTIFSDEGGTPKANPFTADSDSFWFFWADNARYDVQFSGAGISTPFTLFSLQPTVDVSGLADPGGNGFLARTSLGVTAARTFFGTTSEIVVSNGTGGGNPVWSLDTNLNFAGKTISGGTFLAPAISSFQNALHDHDDNAGGGQLNATNVFSAGTVPVARLPIMVGASGVANGVAGLVPQPVIGDESRFLRGDGTWQVTGGGGGTPGGANTTIQYNNLGAFGGVSGATSDGTNITFGSANLRATSPRLVTNIQDTNGNVWVTISAVGGAVNNLQIANAAAGSHPVLSAVGAGADLNIVLTPKGAGIVDTVGNFRITNNAPQITLIDANDTKTVRIGVNGANWDFTNDTLGSVPIRIDTTTNAILIPGNLTVNNTNPSVIFDDTAGTDAKIHLDASVLRLGSTSVDHISLDVGTGVATFAQIPVLPASNPTTDNQATRKLYVDTKKISFNVGFSISDPANASTNTRIFGSWPVPEGGTYTITKLKVFFREGSHTAGGDITFTFDRMFVGDIGSIDLDDTNNTAGTVYENNIGDITPSANEIFSVRITARSGTITELNVMAMIEGFRTPF